MKLGLGSWNLARRGVGGCPANPYIFKIFKFKTFKHILKTSTLIIYVLKTFTLIIYAFKTSTPTLTLIIYAFKTFKHIFKIPTPITYISTINIQVLTHVDSCLSQLFINPSAGK